jgi:hypothetical protein
MNNPAAVIFQVAFFGALLIEGPSLSWIVVRIVRSSSQFEGSRNASVPFWQMPTVIS